MDPSTVALDVITAKTYGGPGYPHDAWTRLRREGPVHWCHPPGYRREPAR